MSALDALLRLEMRAELKRLQRDLGRTLVYVTHDQVEAMSMPDRVAVLREGVVQQVDTPEAIYHRPANRFVATVIGSPPMNFVPVTVAAAAGRPRFVHESFVLELVSRPRLQEHPVREGAEWFVGVRPEDISIVGAGDDGFEATVYATEPLGGETVVDLTIGDRVIKALAPPAFDAAPDERVRIALDPAGCTSSTTVATPPSPPSAPKTSSGGCGALNGPRLPGTQEAGAPTAGELHRVEREKRIRIRLGREDLEVVPPVEAARLEGAQDPRQIDDAVAGERPVVPVARVRPSIVHVHGREARRQATRVLEHVLRVPQVPGVEDDPDLVHSDVGEQLDRPREVADERDSALAEAWIGSRPIRTPSSRATRASSRRPSTAIARASEGARSPCAPVRRRTTSGSKAARRRIEPASSRTRSSGSAGSAESAFGRIESSVGKQIVACSPDSRKRSSDSASRPSGSLNSAMPIPRKRRPRRTNGDPPRTTG